MCCFHLLVLLAVYNFTCSKLGERKKSRRRLGDCKNPPKHSLLAEPLDQKCLRTDLISEEKKDSDMPVSRV